MRHILCIAALAMGLAPGLVQAQADDYPSKPVMVVVPYEGGGVVEQEFRLFMNSIRETTGKSFVMENRAGAGTTIGTAFAAKAAPDGYTLLTVNSPFTVAPTIYPDLPYDSIKDFSPISLLTKHAFLIMVHPSAPFKNAREYIQYAREHPGELNYSTAGIGSAAHLTGMMLHYLSKTKVTFVHYKNSNQRMVDLMAGRVHSTSGTFAISLGNIKAGKLRAIGVTSKERVPVWPDMPTIAEQGVPDYDHASWVGISAPARVPPAIINKLNGMFVQALKDPKIIKTLEGDGTIMVGSTPEVFRRHIIAETNRWRTMIRESGIKMGD